MASLKLSSTFLPALSTPDSIKLPVRRKSRESFNPSGLKDDVPLV